MNGLLYLPESDLNVVNAKREEDGIERQIWSFAKI